MSANIHDFENELREIYPNNHLFDILNLTENNVSKIIAWLMSDAKLSKNFMSCFLKQIAKDDKICFFTKKNKELKTKKVSIDKIFRNVYVTTEYSVEYRKRKGRIDLLVIDTDNNLALVIENKFGSGLHDNQLKLYKNFCLEKTSLPCAFVYLDVNYDGNNQGIEENWKAINYDCISEFIKKEINKVSEPERSLLSSFYEKISDQSKEENDKYYIKLCKVVEKYAKILDGIAKVKEGGVFDSRNITDNQYFFLYQKYFYIIDDLLTCKKYQKIYDLYNKIKDKYDCVSDIALGNGIIDITTKEVEAISDKRDILWFLYTHIQQNKEDKMEINTYIVADIEDENLSKKISEKFACIGPFRHCNGSRKIICKVSKHRAEKAFAPSCL